MSFLTFLGGEVVVGEGSREFLHVFRRGNRSWRVCVGFGEGSRRVEEGNWDFVLNGFQDLSKLPRNNKRLSCLTLYVADYHVSKSLLHLK